MLLSQVSYAHLDAKVRILGAVLDYQPCPGGLLLEYNRHVLVIDVSSLLSDKHKLKLEIGTWLHVTGHIAPFDTRSITTSRRLQTDLQLQPEVQMQAMMIRDAGRFGPAELVAYDKAVRGRLRNNRHDRHRVEQGKAWWQEASTG